MYLYPGDILEKLEFDRILKMLSQYCLGEPAREVALKMSAFTSGPRIESLLDEIVEFRFIMSSGMDFPLGRYEAIKEELSLLTKVGYVLETEDYLKIYRHISLIGAISSFFRKLDKEVELPLLRSISKQIEFDTAIPAHFERIFDDEGEVRPGASPELKRIYSVIRGREKELDRSFAMIIEKYRKLGYLADTVESYKNSRRVLSVHAEHKRKIKGIIHDESSTGKTVFIEPDQIVELNNALFDLEGEKRMEIYKILQKLSAVLRPHIETFRLWQKIIIRFDLIRAKAHFAEIYKGQRPEIADAMKLNLIDAYHPLLKILNDSAGKNTIPLSVSLDSEKRMLMISGPNAGGKSISLKNIALNQLMLQSGMLVPVSGRSKFPVFSKMMIDIGDQQSIEADLSTYSSRLIHMKQFVEQAGKKSLVLIDEFGSGSDPRMGGAIAEGVLDQLVQRRCFAVITTHYSNIKNYAYDNAHILSGAMLFDKEQLQPTYMLRVGKPGSSFAFEIANKIGLPASILEYARNRAGRDRKTVDQMLIDLQHERKILAERDKRNKEEEKRLKQLISNYEKLREELTVRRKKLKMESRQQALQSMSETERELQQLVRELKKDRDLEKAQKSVEKLKKEKKKSVVEVRELAEDVFREEIKEVEDLTPGQYVRLRNGTESGKVIQVGRKKVRVEMGLIQVEVPKSEIIIANKPIEKKGRTITTDTRINPHALESQLDIRGYSRAEAMDALQEFFDNALMSSIPQLKVLHGKGSGILRKAVREKASEYRDISKIWHPEEEFGGRGVTLLSFK